MTSFSIWGCAYLGKHTFLKKSWEHFGVVSCHHKSDFAGFRQGAGTLGSKKFFQLKASAFSDVDTPKGQSFVNRFTQGRHDFTWKLFLFFCLRHLKHSSYKNGALLCFFAFWTTTTNHRRCRTMHGLRWLRWSCGFDVVVFDEAVFFIRSPSRTDKVTFVWLVRLVEFSSMVKFQPKKNRAHLWWEKLKSESPTQKSQKSQIW